MNNYRTGRAFEYRRKKIWERDGYVVLRTAGSHGFADLIAVRSMGDVIFIQCKYTKSRSVARKLLREFKADPTLSPLGNYKQCIEIYNAHDRELLTWTI